MYVGCCIAAHYLIHIGDNQIDMCIYSPSNLDVHQYMSNQVVIGREVSQYSAPGWFGQTRSGLLSGG